MPWSCPWSRDQRNVDISPPLEAVSQKEGVGQSHAFRSKTFKKPRSCHWCHQPVYNGSCCRVCKYVCHTTCENKLATSVKLILCRAVVADRGLPREGSVSTLAVCKTRYSAAARAVLQTRTQNSRIYSRAL
ncbi:unnamed protein product [Leptosia nina]|uniref:Phorbol-ester/DAG-type domain-containing protein n=1 Tax=Leptosia nina TaxID=320188 RepID=A0AAV1JKH1_9NEOP